MIIIIIISIVFAVVVAVIILKFDIYYCQLRTEVQINCPDPRLSAVASF